MKNAERTTAYIDDAPSRLEPDTIQQLTSSRFVIDRLSDEPLLLNLGAAQRVVS